MRPDQAVNPVPVPIGGIEERDVQLAGQRLRAPARLTGRGSRDDEQVAARAVRHACDRIRRCEVEEGGERKLLGIALDGLGGPPAAFEHEGIVPDVRSGVEPRIQRGHGHLDA